MRVLILAPYEDMQTGVYLLENFKKVSSDVLLIDTRKIIYDTGGTQRSQEIIIEEIINSRFNPDIILVLKGLEITPDTYKRIKQLFPSAIHVNWMFDKFIGDVPVWENVKYIDFIKLFDYFFCSLNGVHEKLRELDLNNVYYLPEGCDPNFHSETYLNYYQTQKYASDISFIGSLGYFKQHPNRVQILKRIIEEGFNTTIWGEVSCELKYLPKEIKDRHMFETAINEKHSKIVQCSLINLGIDQDPELSLSQSARLYRVMCAGGLYLNTATKDLNKMFKINETRDSQITKDLELVVYYDTDDLISKLDFLLEHDDIRTSIARNGQKAVLSSHKFSDRIDVMLKTIKRRNKHG